MKPISTLVRTARRMNSLEVGLIAGLIAAGGIFLFNGGQPQQQSAATVSAL